jgi:hypothetical protein
LATFIFVIRHLEKLSKNYSNLISFSHLQTKPAAEGQTSPEKTDRGYELRSQGPATLGLDALDTRTGIWIGSKGSILFLA